MMKTSSKAGREPRRRRRRIQSLPMDPDQSHSQASFPGQMPPDGVVADEDEEEDDDEENLEANAARMLSSRFDTSSTGFSSKRKISASQKASESSFPIPSTLDSSVGVDSARGDSDSGDDDQSRELRPRREDKGKGVPRKRRHFYEIPPKDLEPHFVLNRKIKVFWPLDESWYFGHVYDYHPECRLYHIKYDDCDEEWVDLNEEKFKLLLYASEVPGRDKPKKFSRAQKNVHKVETVPPEDGDDDIETDLDSEPIASWVARLSRRGKSPSKSLKTEEISSKGRCNADCESTSTKKSLVNGVGKSLIATSNLNHLVYVRKKNQTSGDGHGSVLRYFKAIGSASKIVNPVDDPLLVSFPVTRMVDSEKQVWSFDYQGKVWFNIRFVQSKKFRLWVDLPSLPYWEYSLQTVDSSLLHDVFMFQYGVLLPTSYSVMLEMLFIDGHHGLSFVLFEGCDRQAIAFFSKILIFFSEVDEIMYSDMQSPVISMRFRLSGVQDLRKNHVIEFHSFSTLQSSKWDWLNSELRQHCLLLKQLPASECTYDNIKELESLKQCEPYIGSQLSSHAGLNKESALGILPVGVSRKAYSTRTNQSAVNSSGKVPSYVIFSCATPTFLFTQHLQVLMKKGPIPSQASNLGSKSGVGNMVDISSTHRVGVAFEGKESVSRQGSDVARSVNEGINQSPNPSRHSLQGVRNNSITHADQYPKWVDGTPKFMRRRSSSGPKMPHYAMLGADYEVSTKPNMQNQRSLLGKRIRRESLKRIFDASRSNQKNIELQVCEANVLVTCGDRGWRECGALIVLEVAENNEWRLSIKLGGITRYSYKVNNILQPGSTNRYSHAVLWKGGKDWGLEFTERSQWNLFKEMHGECYNRNVRAASVKNIPIPGVQLVEEFDDYCGTEAPFVRNPKKYLRHVQNDVEMAMDPLHVLYDMDSDDEHWLMSNQEGNNENGFEELSDDFLEKAISIFEKASYVTHCTNFTDDELQELVAGMGSLEAAKLVYEHWRKKRARKGMPVLRELQPPLWERYQQQLKEWENAVARGNSGSQEKTPVPEKPAMFAFFQKPRGLDSRNKSFKQRPHRKYLVSGHLHSRPADHVNFYDFGRRSSGRAYGNAKISYTNNAREPSDTSPLPPSMRLLSPRDAHYTLSAAVSVASPSPRLYSTKRRKLVRDPSSDNQQTTSPYGQRQVGHKNGVQQRNMGFPNSSSQMDLGKSDLNESRMRDAAAVAQHALNMARLKREKAHILFDKADLAIQRAVIALMTAEAIKASYESVNGSS